MLGGDSFRRDGINEDLGLFERHDRPDKVGLVLTGVDVRQPSLVEGNFPYLLEK